MRPRTSTLTSTRTSLWSTSTSVVRMVACWATLFHCFGTEPTAAWVVLPSSSSIASSWFPITNTRLEATFGNDDQGRRSKDDDDDEDEDDPKSGRKKEGKQKDVEPVQQQQRQQGEEGEQLRQRRHMAIVRSLQMSYYKPTMTVVVPDDNDNNSSNSNGTATIINSKGKKKVIRTTAMFPDRCILEETTGQVLHLPLFRVPWWEVPGRSNVLNIHEPIYTNMFETILYGPKPWTYGHLYLEGGSRNLNSQEFQYRLESWNGTATTTTSSSNSKSKSSSSTSSSPSSSAVLGCLMNICDYRRLADGRLLLLVHAIERFVVTDVEQRLPYGIVSAQLLPDAEEIDPVVDFGSDWTEDDLKLPRALAIQESVRYHDYEYDGDHKLPIPNRADMEMTDISGSAIAKVLPFCPFSKTLEPPVPSYEPDALLIQQRQEMKTEKPGTGGDDDTAVVVGTNQQEQTMQDEPTSSSQSVASLEYRLLCRGIYQTPLTDPEFPQRQGLTTDQLEYELWLAINNFLIQTRTPVSPVLLGLLPIHLDIWPTTVPSIVATTTTTSMTTTGTTTTMEMADGSQSQGTEVNSSNSTATSSFSSISTATTTSSSSNNNITTSIPSKPFALKQIVSELSSLNSVDHDFVQVSPHYPPHRRQRRLSYAAAHLLEANAKVANEWRPRLLAMPTTRQRLRLVLEALDQWQEATWGEFQ